MASHRHIVADQDTAGIHDVEESRDDVVAERFNAGRKELHHKRVAVPVDDQRRKRVGLGVNQAVGRRARRERASVRMRRGQAFVPEGGIDGPHIVTEHP
jgi:hypothetical protein